MLGGGGNWELTDIRNEVIIKRKPKKERLPVITEIISDYEMRNQLKVEDTIILPVVLLILNEQKTGKADWK